MLYVQVHRTIHVLFFQITVKYSAQLAACLADINQVLPNHDLVIFNPGQLQDVIDNIQKLLGRNVDVFQAFFLRFHVAAFQGEGGKAQNGVHWCANVM